MKNRLFPIIYSIILAAFTVYLALDTFLIDDIDYSELEAMYKSDMSAKTPVADKETASQSSVDITTPLPTPAIGFPGDLPEGYWDDPYAFYGDDAAFATTATPSPTDIPTPTDTPTPTPVVPTYTANSYTDENMTLTITKYRENDSDVYIVDIKIDSAEKMKAGLGPLVRERYMLTSEIAKAYNAILAINGDCYVERKNGYVIRNGVLLREDYAESAKSRSNPDMEDFVIFSDGHCEIIREGDETAKQLLERGAWNLWSFGPTLVKDGRNVYGEKELPAIATETCGRTAIGYYSDCHYCFIIVDGRSWTKSCGFLNRGFTCKKLAEFAKEKLPDLQILYNLDGGGSTTLYFNGEVQNQPCRFGDKIGEQHVNDIIYIGY